MIISRPHISSADVAALLAAGPAEGAAFLPARSQPAKLAETMAGLANGHGGTLLIGVSSGGRLTGIDDPEQERAAVQAAQLLVSPPLILPMPQFVHLQETTVCALEVPPGLPHAYSVGGRYLTRAGKQNRLLSTSELSSLLLERSEAGFEGRPVPGATLDDLDPARVESYLSSMEGLAGGDWQTSLVVRGCLVASPEGALPTYAGLLLFGRAPQRFLHNARIILVRYAGAQMGDEFLRQEAGGTLPEQIRQAEAFVSANMRRGMRLRGLVREETAEYPLAVVREAVVNAIAHRDYAIRGEGIRVLMFSEHMEIYSPGRLPGHVTLDNLVNERFSRNEAIVQVLSDMGFVEQLGYGIDRMVATMAEAGLPPPAFEETVAGFKVTLHGRGDELVSSDTAARWGNRGLTGRQEQALAYVVQHGRITNREFHELFPDISDETIRRDLADLVDQGLIMKVGDRKATYYILK
jgi:ATP-dependent DNA helicase RecG